MAIPVINKASFVGWNKITGNQFREDKLLEYITLFEQEYMRMILGDSAFLEIEADTLPRPKWTDLMNGVDYTNLDGDNKRNTGITDQLIKFIYFEFIRDNFASTQVGKVKSSNENSVILTGDEVGSVVRARYNSAVRALHESIFLFLENYEQIDEPVTGFVDNADNTYTINVAKTLYLIDADTITIGGTNFIISGLVVDTSFVIDAGAVGLSFTGDVTYKPYEIVEFDRLIFSTI